MTRLLLVAIFGIVLSPAITGQVIKPSSTTNPVCSTLGDIYYNTTTNHSRVCTAKAVGMTPDVWTVISGEINAETYGAKCDGTSDDTAAINSALGLGLPVRLPNGTCQSKGIVPASNSSLLCYGECIVRYLAPAAQRSLVYAGTTATSIQNFSVRGITFDENAVVPTGGGRNAIIDVENGYNVFIDHCVFKSSGTPIDNIGAAYFYNTFGSFTGNSVESTVHGLHVYVNAVSSQNQVIVAGNQLAGSFYNSIYVYNNHEGPNYAKITNNHIRDVTDPFGGNGQTGNCIVVYQSDYTLIDGNSCYNADFSGVRVSSSRSVIVSGNTVDRAAETSMYAELGSEGVIFTHNIITNCAGGITMTNVNMRAYGASTSLPALSLKNVAIANTVWGCSDYGIQTENDDVIDNKIVDVAYGIVIGNGGTGHDIVVRGNSLNNTGGIFTLGPINSGTSTCTSSSIAFSSSGSLCAAPPAGEYFANTAGVVIGTDLSNAGSGCIHAEFLTATFPCSPPFSVPARLNNMIVGIAVDRSLTSATNKRIVIENNQIAGQTVNDPWLPVAPVYAIDRPGAMHIVNITRSATTLIYYGKGNVPPVGSIVALSGISGIEALNGRLGRVTFNFTTPVNTLFLQYGGSGYTPNLTNYSWPVSAAGCSPVTTVGLTTNSVGTITGGTISPGSNCTSVPIIDMDANCSSHNCQGSVLVQLRATLDIDTSNSTAFPNPYALPRARNRFPLAMQLYSSATGTPIDSHGGTPAFTLPAVVQLNDGALLPGKGPAVTEAATVNVAYKIHPITFIAGASAISTINGPLSVHGGPDNVANGPYGLQDGEVITFLPDSGVSFTATGGNIGAAPTITANVPVSFRWDATSSKWWPQ